MATRSVSAAVAAALETELATPSTPSPSRSMPQGLTPRVVRRPLAGFDALLSQHRVGTPTSPSTPGTPASLEAGGVVPVPGVGFAGVSDDANKRWRASNEDVAVVVPILHADDCASSSPGADDTASLSSLHSVDELPRGAAGFFGVYDGHNGDAAARAAGARLHGLFAAQLAEECAVPDAFARAYALLDAQLRRERLFDTGCTAVTCFVHANGGKRVLTTANVGDARAVLCRAGEAHRLSTDHRAGDEMERKRIESAGGFVCARRVNGVLEVSRALGDHSFKSVVVCTPDVSNVALGDADEFVVLACDGLWDVMSDAHAVALASAAFDDGCAADDVSALLVKAALAAGSTDNVTVVVVSLGGLC